MAGTTPGGVVSFHHNGADHVDSLYASYKGSHML
jgi:hypothetical protein